jgi:hypothetical protein
MPKTGTPSSNSAASTAGARLVHARRAAGQDDRRRVAGEHLGHRHRVRHDLGVDPRLADPAGDQLGVLGRRSRPRAPTRQKFMPAIPIEQPLCGARMQTVFAVICAVTHALSSPREGPPGCRTSTQCIISGVVRLIEQRRQLPNVGTMPKPGGSAVRHDVVRVPTRDRATPGSGAERTPAFSITNTTAEAAVARPTRDRIDQRLRAFRSSTARRP